MRKHLQTLYILVVSFFLFIPLLSLVGLSSKTKVYGFEKVAKKPTICITSCFSGEFQKGYERWWDQNFGFRKNMLKFKNTLYDISNLGFFHAGYGGNIVQGKNGHLFEKAYIKGKLFKDKNAYKRIDESARLLREFNEILKKKNISSLVVVAPNKADAYPENIPDYWIYFADNKEDRDVNIIISEYLSKANVPFFDSASYVYSVKKTVPFDIFPYSGTHWNMYAAGVAAQKSFENINQLYKKDYTVPKIEKVVYTKEDDFYERDLANLLNTQIKYRNANENFPLPTYDTKLNIEDKIMIYGDSYSSQYKSSLIEMGLKKEQIFYFENTIPSDVEIESIFKDAKIFILIFNGVSFSNGRVISAITPFIERDRLQK